MKKVKILSAVLIMAMLLGAAGCSKETGSNGPGETASEVETEVESEIETEAPATSESASTEQVTDTSEDTGDEYIGHEFVFEENIDPDTTFFEHSVTIYGTEIMLPCTLGDLKALGYEPYMDVYMGDLEMDYMLNGEPEFDIRVMFEDPELEVDEEDVKDLPDDMLVVAINVYGEFPQYDFNGVKNGMTEDEVLSILGTPAFVVDLHEMGHVYYYTDKAGNAYCFSFAHFINETEPVVLKMIEFGSPDRLPFLPD